MADQLTVTDGPLTLTDDLCDGRFYSLAAKIEGAIARASEAELGPGVNALYARTLAAAQADPALAALVQVREGNPEGISFDLSINRHAYNAVSAEFGLTIQLLFWQSDGAAPRREPALEALTAAIDAATAGPDPCVREAVHLALAARLQADIGLPVHRNAARPVTGSVPILIFQDGPQIADDSTQGLVLYVARPALEIFVPSQDAALLDAILQSAIASVRAMDRLGGVTLDVCEGETDPDVLRELYGGPMLGGRLELEAYFMTPWGQPYVSAAA